MLGLPKVRRSTIHFMKMGLPFFAFMVIASVGLSKVINPKQKVSGHRAENQNSAGSSALSPSGSGSFGQNLKLSRDMINIKTEDIDIQKELNNLNKSMEWEKEYENKRVPRTPQILKEEAEQAEARKQAKIKAAHQASSANPFGR